MQNSDYMNIDYAQYQTLGNKPSTVIVDTAKVTIDEIKDAFHKKNSVEAFDMLCDVIKEMNKRIEELEGK